MHVFFLIFFVIANFFSLSCYTIEYRHNAVDYEEIMDEELMSLDKIYIDTNYVFIDEITDTIKYKGAIIPINSLESDNYGLYFCGKSRRDDPDGKYCRGCRCGGCRWDSPCGHPCYCPG